MRVPSAFAAHKLVVAPPPALARPPTRIVLRRGGGGWDDETDARAACEGTLAAWRPRGKLPLSASARRGRPGQRNGRVATACRCMFPRCSLTAVSLVTAGRGTGATAGAVPALSASSRRGRPGSAKRRAGGSGLMIPRPVPFHSLPSSSCYQSAWSSSSNSKVC